MAGVSTNLHERVEIFKDIFGSIQQDMTALAVPKYFPGIVGAAPFGKIKKRIAGHLWDGGVAGEYKVGPSDTAHPIQQMTYGSVDYQCQYRRTKDFVPDEEIWGQAELPDEVFADRAENLSRTLLLQRELDLINQIKSTADVQNLHLTTKWSDDAAEPVNDLLTWIDQVPGANFIFVPRDVHNRYMVHPNVRDKMPVDQWQLMMGPEEINAQLSGRLGVLYAVYDVKVANAPTSEVSAATLVSRYTNRIWIGKIDQNLVPGGGRGYYQNSNAISIAHMDADSLQYEEKREIDPPGYLMIAKLAYDMVHVGASKLITNVLTNEG